MNKRLSFLLLVVVLFTAVGLMAQDKMVLPTLEPIDTEYAPSAAKPGGIQIGPALPRGFHYGGRHAVRDLDGHLHVTWEDPTYNFNYYARSLDTLGLEWTDPINPHDAVGMEVDRALMAKMAIDPVTGYLYMMPFHRINPGERYRTGITRSKDGGETWSPYMDLNTKLGREDEEVSWGTFTIGQDQIMHIAYAKNNVDIMYTRADVAGNEDLANLEFTRSDGTTQGDEAISFVPSGVVFQGTIVLDRNDDPHVIFSGDGGSNTFGDKTPYHVYYKSEAQAWGPIPPTQLQAELEQCWGMPEMVFDQNNRGYYFLDNNPGTFTFGTWEPPSDPASAVDFGTLNNGQGPEGAIDLIQDNFTNLEIVDDDILYLPQGDVDDKNDAVYVVGSSQGYGSGGDIVALELADAGTYSGQNPADMDWQVKRWVTNDGAGLGDIGPDIVYDPSSTHLDIFWSGAGPNTNLAYYLDASIPPPATDPQAKSIEIGIPGDKLYVNEGDEIEIIGVVKNNGTSPISPVPVTATISGPEGSAVFTADYTSPPLAAGQETPPIVFGTWMAEGAGQTFSMELTLNYAGDEAEYNNSVGTSFFIYPSMDNSVGYADFQPKADWTGNFPTYVDGELFTNGGDWYPADPYAGGWTVVDHINGEFGDARDDYISTWALVEDSPGDTLAQMRYQQGVRGDTLYGDIEPIPGWDDTAYAQPQHEDLVSPEWTLSNSTDFQYFFEWRESLSAEADEDNPLEANVELTTDGGTTWQTVLQRRDETELDDIGNSGYESYEVTEMLSGASAVQFRFVWKNLQNDGVSFNTWIVDDIYLVKSPKTGVEGGHAAPVTYALEQNYPNPFNPVTTISYALPKAGPVKLVVYNLRGEEVMTLVDKEMAAGRHNVEFRAADFSSGVYFYSLTAKDFSTTRKMLLLK